MLIIMNALLILILIKQLIKSNNNEKYIIKTNLIRIWKSDYIYIFWIIITNFKIKKYTIITLIDN